MKCILKISVFSIVVMTETLLPMSNMYATRFSIVDAIPGIAEAITGFAAGQREGAARE